MMVLGPKILEGLLYLEATDEKQKSLILLPFAIIPLAFYFLHFFVIDTNFELRLAIANDALAVLTLCSLVWIKPLHVVLGLDRATHEYHEAESVGKATACSCMAQSLFQDTTLRLTAYSNLIAFVVMFTSDATMFIGVGWLHTSKDTDAWYFDRYGDDSPPLFLAIVYILGSFYTTGVTALGLGYIALVHNVFAAQLAQVAHRLDELSAEDAESYGTIPSRSSLGGSDLTDNLIVDADTANDITVDSLMHQYFEFRRRQEALAQAFHRRVLFVIFTFGIEIILMVTAGFKDHKADFTNLETGALMVLFMGNAYSLWTATFTMGRVPFVSREEYAFSARKWALLKKPAAIPVSQTMAVFPITFHMGPFEWGIDMSKAFTIFLLSLAGVFVGIKIPEFD